nr:HAMP domain-containing protein [Pseudomonadota bacterium]
MHGRLSLREGVVVLMVAAILPLFALSVWLALRETRSATDLVQSQLKFAAALVAANQDGNVEAAQQLLGAVSVLPQLQEGGHDRCQRYFEGLLKRFPEYSDIGLLGLDGQVTCHANGRLDDANAANQDYFREAVAKRRFVMGEAVVGRLPGLRAIPFAVPVLREGAVTSVVFATLNMDKASAALARIELPAGSRVLVIDRHDRVLMEHPARTERPVPRSLVSDHMQLAAHSVTSGVGEGRDADGEMRVYAYAPSRGLGSEGFMAVLSIGKAQIAGGSLMALRQELLVLLLTLLLGVAGAWWVGGRVIVRPAGEILRAVRRLESGELDARIPMHDDRLRGEFSRIASAFNLMALSLQVRQQDREAEL